MTSPADESGAPADPGAPAIREQLRTQMLSGLGGWSGMVVAAIPTVVFVIVNTVSTLRVAVLTAIGAAVLLTIYRLIRRQPVQQALSGLLGVVVAAAIAARTGQARGFFLLGIGASLLYGGACLVSLIVRRPAVGLIWEYLDPTPNPTSDPTSDPTSEPTPAGEHGAGAPTPWYRRSELFRAYMWATIAVTAVFAARGAVQLTLFAERHTGWLAVTRIAMGYPLTALAAAFAFWIVRRARQRITAPVATEAD